MSTNTYEAAESLQLAISRCNKLHAEIQRVIDGKDAAVDAGVDANIIREVELSLTKAMKHCHKSKRSLQATAIMLKSSKHTLQQSLNGDGDGGDPPSDTPIPCGC